MTVQHKTETLGYSHLYRNLMSDITYRDFWYLVDFSFGGQLLLLLLVIVFADMDDVSTLTPIFLLVFVLTAFLLSVVIIVSAALMSTRDPTRLANKVAARLIARYTRPYDNETGLAYRDIQALQRVAKIDQDAGDWRRAFVDLIIIGSVTVLFGIGTFFLQTIGAIEGMEILGQIWQSSIRLITVFFNSIPWFMWPASFLVALAIWRLYTYLRMFAISEFANRTILLACEEVLRLLDRYDLTNSTSLSLSQRRALVEKLGWQLVSNKQAARWQALTGTKFETSSGETWILTPFKLKDAF